MPGIISTYCDAACFHLRTFVCNQIGPIYPNPTTDLININIEHQSLFFNEIHVYNLQGQLVKTANLNAENNTIVDLYELSAGTYLIQIFTLDKTQYIIQKVIKMK